VNFFKEIWDFPAHHVSMAWWIALFGVFFFRIFGRFFKQLPIWGRKYRIKQLSRRIALLEELHNDTNALLRTLAQDVIDVAIDFCWLCASFVILYYFSQPIKLETALFIISISMGSSVAGRAMRIRRMLNDLARYDTRIGALKEKLTQLQN
jgi:hypothetical protein